MLYKKYFRKTILKQKVDGDFFLNLIKEKTKNFFRSRCLSWSNSQNMRTLHEVHDGDFKYIGLDLFEKVMKINLKLFRM